MKTRPARNFLSLASKLIFVLFVSVAMPGASWVLGQDDTPKRGFQPASSFTLSDVETINTTNGNLILNFPIGSLPPGRGGMSATLRLFYNSKLYDTYPEWVFWNGGNPNPQVVQQNHLAKSSEGGWRYGTGYQLLVFNKMDQYMGLPGDLPPMFDPTPRCSQTPNDAATHRWKLKIATPDGGAHEMVPLGYTNYQGEGYYRISPDGYFENCQGGQWVTNDLTYYSVDGSFLKLVIKYNPAHNGFWNNEWTLYFPDGGRVTTNEPGSAGQRFYDRNNNYVELQGITHNGNPATKLVDQLGRWVILEYNSGFRQDSIHQQGINGAPLTWTIKWKSVQVQNKKYVCADGASSGDWPHEEYLNISHYVVDQIILPQSGTGLNYTFGYNPGTSSPSYGWGEINSITLPTGEVNPRAQVSYQYTLDGQDGANSGISWKDVLKSSAPSRKDLTYLREYDGSVTSSTDTWQYSISPAAGSSIVIAPDGGSVSQTYGGDTGNPNWGQGLIVRMDNADGSVVERIWAENKPSGLPVMYTGVNTYVKTEFISIRNAAGALVKTAIKDYTYDKNGNITQVAEYDWMDYGSVPRDGGAPTGIPAGINPKRVSINSYYNATPDASNTTTDDPDVYHKPGSPNIKRALESSETRSGFSAGSALARAESFYDNPSTTGNLTLERKWDSTKGGISRPLSGGNSISVTRQYDPYGNLTHTTDANNVTTWLIYGQIDGHGNLYATETKVAANTPVQRWTVNSYDFNTGLVTQSTDVDNNVTTQMVYDVFGRPTIVKEAVGTTSERWTRTEYDDQARRVVVRAALDTTDDQKLVTIQHYDQLGRVRLARQLENPNDDVTNETLGMKVQTRYYAGDANNPDPAYRSACQAVSNPYRAATSGAAGSGENSHAMGWARTKFDKGGRVVEIQNFGANLPQPWGTGSAGVGAVITEYDGEVTTVTDQAGKKRRSKADALGRLVEIIEDPAGLNYATIYLYDPLNNLRYAQQGAQERRFSYDSLSRLIRARNPEQDINNSLPPYTDPFTGDSGWSTAYSYDANGNLVSKIDARNITTNYSYDALNRNTSVDYSNTPTVNPDITRHYDNPLNGGRFLKNKSRYAKIS